MKRRLIAGFLTLCMIVSLCPPSAFAVHSSASEMTEPETVVTEPAADTGAPEETAAPDPVPSEPQKEPEPTQPEETLPEGTLPEGTQLAGALPAQTQPAQTQPGGTLPEGEEYSYRSISVGQTVTLTTGLAEGGSWTSDNLAAATVTSAEGDTLNALVYGVAAGVTTVTYTADGAEERWVVYVNDPAVQTGETTGETVAAEAPADSEQATVEDQPQGGSVLDKLGDLLTGTADTQAAAASTTATQKTIYVGDTITLTGSGNKYWRCDYAGEWESRDPAKAEVSGTGTSATLKGLAAGTVTVTHTYCNNSEWWDHTHSYGTDTFEITVQARTLTGVTVSGENTVIVGVPTQLTATAEPAGAEMNLTWESSDADTLTVTETGLITGVKAGTATVTVTDESTKLTASHTVTVRNVVPVTDVTLTGVGDTMTAFTDAQLTATVEPTNADVAGHEWESSSEEILTVDQNGNVTAVAPGEAEIRYTVTTKDGTRFTKTHKITVTAPASSTDSALFYYLIDPDGDPKSNTAGWGTTLGEGTVNMEGAQWQDSNKNCYGVSGRIISWPSGFESGNIPKGDHWTAIFNAYKSKVEKDLGVTITEADVEYIHVHPFKISRNNASNPDKHVDCTVEVKTKSVYTAVYKLWDAGDTGYVQQAAKNYKAGAPTDPGEFTPIANLPTTKDANGVTYTFDGWYTNETRTGSKVNFPYTLDANTTFYAKYVAGYFVTYNLNSGSWNHGTSYRKNEGSIVNIISEEPTRPGYKFTGWTSAEISADQIKAGTFTMPAKNVTLTAQWEKSDFTVKYRYTGTVPTNAPEPPEDTTRTYDTTVRVAEKPTLTGYNFIGWTTEDAEITDGTFTMPAKDVTLSGSWEKKTVGYTVEYYYDGIRIPSKTETGTAEFGDVINKYTEKPETGYKLDHTDNLPLTIGEDANANVIKVYYVKDNAQQHRVSYRVDYYRDGAPVESGTPETVTDWISSPIFVNVDKSKINTADKFVGYKFVKTEPMDIPDRYDVAANGESENHVINVYYVKDESQTHTVSYHVEYYKDGVHADTDAAVSATGWIGEATTVTVNTAAINTTDKYVGYKLDKTEPGTIPANYTVAANAGSGEENVIKVYYVKDGNQTQPTKYTVRYTINGAEKESFDVTGTAWINDSPAMIAIAADGIPAPEDKFQGYKLDPANPTYPAPGTQVKSGSVYTVNYVARNDTAYKVEHYQQNLADDEYTLANTDKMSGTTGELTAAVARSYPGFTAQSFNQMTIAPDGSTVVRIYYNRNTYTVTYTDGVIGETVFEDRVTKNVRYGTATPAFGENPTRTGYVFAGWDPTVAGTVTADATYTAKWNPATGTAYTVKHYQQNLEDDGYELTDTDNMSGTTGELTKAAAKVYPGFTAQTFEQKTIAPNGSTVVDIYYTRNSYKVTYAYADPIPAGASKLPDEATYKYGASVTVADAATATGYTFSGWSRTGSFEMPAENVTITGSFTKRTDLSYRVNYLEKDTGNVLHAQKVQNGMTFDDVVKASDEIITIDGYTYDSADKETLTITTGDNVINLYYTKRTNLTATVNYYWNGTTEKVHESKTVTGLTFQQTLNESPIPVAGCTPVSDASQTIIIGTGANVIDFYYYKNVELTANSKTGTYDGTKQTVEGYTGAPAGADFSGITVSASGTDAGTYDAKFADGTVNTVDAAGKYIVTKATDGKLTINKRTVTLTSETASKPYDGMPLEKPNVAVTGDGFVNGEVTDVRATGSVTHVAQNEVTNTITYTKKENFKASNYTITVEEGKLSITPVAIELTAASGSKPYDGTALTNDGYTITSGKFVGEEGLASVTVAGSQTLVGSSNNAITGYALKDNTAASDYTITTRLGTLTVTDRDDGEKYAITVKANSGSKTYDGTKLTVDGFETLSFTVNGQTYTVEGLTAHAEGTNVSDSKAVTVTGTPVVKDTAGNDVTAQFTVTTKNGTLTINPVAIELTAASDSKPYDGTALTNNGYAITSGEFVGEEGLASVTVEGSQTLVGSSNNTITRYALKDNTAASDYTITTRLGTLTVTDRDDGEKYVITVKANSGSKTYDGTKLTVDGFETLSFTVNGQTYTVEGLTAHAEGTNVSDSKTVTVTGTPVVKDTAGNDVTAQFTVTTKNGTLTINQRNVTLTSASANKQYDGTELTKHEVTVGGEGFVTGEGAAYSYTGSQTTVGKSDNTFTYTPNAGTDEGNYDITVYYGELEVTDRTDKYAIEVEANSGSKTYDGTALKVEGFKTLSFTVNGQTYTVEGLTASAEGTNVSDSKTVTVTGTPVVKDAAGNNVTAQFTVTTKNGTLTITPVAIELTADSASKEYDGKALTKDTYRITNGKFVGEDGLASVTVEGSQTLVGSSNNVITGHKLKEGTLSENYAISYVDGELKVTDRTEKYAIEVEANSGSKTYDGTALKVEGFKTLSFTVNDQIYTVSGLTASAEGTKVSDSKTVTVTGTPVVMDAAGNEVTDQFTVTTKNGTLTINPVAIELTADSASKEYDGMALTKDTYTITNGKFVGEDGLASVTVVGSQTLVGSGKNVITGHELKEGTLPENYAISYMDGELKVTDRAEKYTITVKANSGSKTYDGTKLTVDGFETLSFAVGGNTYTVEGLTAHAEGTNVSDSAAVEVIGTPVVKDAAGNDVTAQFTVNPVNGNLTITPASVTVTADNKSKVFGAAEPELTATVTGTLNGDKVAYTLSRDPGENVGGYTITPTGEKVQGNYEVTYETGTLTITPVTEKVVVTVTGHTGTAVYDGTAHTVTGYDVAVSNPLYTAADFAFDGTASVTGTDAGGYPMGLAESQFRNASANFTEVSFVVNDGGLTVDKRPVTLSSVTDSKVYDRTPLTRSDVTVGGMGFVSGEVTGIRATGSVLNVSEGTVPNPIEFTPAASFKAGNYTIEYHVGTLSVTPAAQATVVVSGKTETVVYDGKPHTVTGFTNDGRSRDITVTLLRAGADSATGTEINRYNMGLTAADFIASSPNYRKVNVEVVDGYLDIVTVNVNVTITVRGNRDTVTYDGSEHNVTGYEIVSITTNVGRNVTMEGLTLKLRGNASATGTEPGTYPMGLTAADFDVDTTIYRGVRVVVEDGELVIESAAAPETEPTETIPDESAPKGQPEDIPDEDVPMAAPAWALLNLILSLLTVLGSLFLLSGLFGKKKEEATDENGNLILDDNGESVMNRIKQRAGWRIISLLPAIGSVIAFILTENMRNPMVLVDRWTLLMVIIAVIQVLVMMLSKKKVEETEEA